MAAPLLKRQLAAYAAEAEAMSKRQRRLRDDLREVRRIFTDTVRDVGADVARTLAAVEAAETEAATALAEQRRAEAPIVQRVARHDEALDARLAAACASAGAGEFEVHREWGDSTLASLRLTALPADGGALADAKAAALRGQLRLDPAVAVDDDTRTTLRFFAAAPGAPAPKVALGAVRSEPVALLTVDAGAGGALLQGFVVLHRINGRSLTGWGDGTIVLHLSLPAATPPTLPAALTPGWYAAVLRAARFQLYARGDASHIGGPGVGLDELRDALAKLSRLY